MSTTLLSQNITFKDSFFTSLHKIIHFLPAHNQRSAANLCGAAAGVPLEIFWRSPLHSCRRRSSPQCLGQGSEWALLLLLLLLFVRSYEAGKTCRARPSAHSLIPRRGLGARPRGGTRNGRYHRVQPRGGKIPACAAPRHLLLLLFFLDLPKSDHHHSPFPPSFFLTSHLAQSTTTTTTVHYIHCSAHKLFLSEMEKEEAKGRSFLFWASFFLFFFSLFCMHSGPR